MKTNKIKTISYTERMSRLNAYRRFAILTKTKKIIKVLGISLIVLGTLTAPFPCGSVGLIFCGFAMIGIKKKDLIQKSNYLKMRLRYKLK